MDFHVGQVIKLARPDCAMFFPPGQFFRQPPRGVDVVVGVGVGGGAHQVQVGSQQFQRIDFFLALGDGHDHRAGVAQRIGQQGEADTGIARGAFNYAAPGRSSPMPPPRELCRAPSGLYRAAGFRNSALPRMVQPVCSDTCLR